MTRNQAVIDAEKSASHTQHAWVAYTLDAIEWHIWSSLGFLGWLQEHAGETIPTFTIHYPQLKLLEKENLNADATPE